jgi:hypothetical protein
MSHARSPATKTAKVSKWAATQPLGTFGSMNCALIRQIKGHFLDVAARRRQAASFEIQTLADICNV